MTTCKIEIRDEVNCKLIGLDLTERKFLSNKFKYEIPGARYQPAVRLGRWDGKVSYFQMGGSTYINLLEEILPYIDSRGYNIQIDDLRDYQTQFSFNEITEETFSHKVWPDKHPVAGQPVVLRDYQIEIINKFLLNPQCLQEIATGAGKCQPLTSKVLTPGGWQEMKDIGVGDKVITPSGKQVAVLNTYHPGDKDVYELTFSDGRKARACGDHIWKVHNIDWKRSRKNNYSPWKNLTTSEIIAFKESNKRAIGIPLVTMEQDSTDIELPMDPWLLGFLLGDGSFRTNGLTFSTADTETLNKVKSKLHSDYTVKHLGNYDYAIQFTDVWQGKREHSKNMQVKNRNSNGHIILGQESSANIYKKIIMDLDLNGFHSHNKFVPEVYFSGSLTQRLEIIRGLVDSDGTIDKSSVYFTSTSEQLALDFQQLIRSIGGIAKLSHSTDRTYVYNGVRTPCKDSYTVATKYPRPWELTSLTRKKDKTGYAYQYGPTLKLNIVSVEKVSTEEVKCILIDDPDHLYVTDDFIVTHNTLITAALSHSCEQYGRTIVIVPNKSLVTQTEADYINLGLDVGVYFGDRKEFGHKHTICTWQSLNILLKNTKAQEADITIGEFIEDVVCIMVDECFDGDSKVLTPTGYVAIKDIKAGDEVINYSEETKEFKIDTVVNQHKNLTNSLSEKMYELEFNNGSRIQVTGNHKFLTNLGWCRADELTEKHEIVNKT